MIQFTCVLLPIKTKVRYRIVSKSSSSKFPTFRLEIGVSSSRKLISKLFETFSENFVETAQDKAQKRVIFRRWGTEFVSSISCTFYCLKFCEGFCVPISDSKWTKLNLKRFCSWNLAQNGYRYPWKSGKMRWKWRIERHVLLM